MTNLPEAPSEDAMLTLLAWNAAYYEQILSGLFVQIREMDGWKEAMKEFGTWIEEHKRELDAEIAKAEEGRS